ncbi:MAG: LruC domain-containing protein [Bacteroidales bacterium]
MKTKNLITACIGALILSACSSENDLPLAGNGSSSSTTNNDKGNVEMVIPVGCRSVRIDYKTASGVKSMTVGVNPEAKEVKGRSVSPITNTSLEIVSPVNTYINIYDESGNLLVENKFIKAATNAVTTQSSNGNVIVMPEDAVNEYVTADGPFTYYHSSGVAMFDDSWPRATTGDGDFNDVVIDYDIEAKIVDENAAPAEAYRECIKVVMHVRAIGGGASQRVGLILDGILSDYIDKDASTCKLTIGNWNEDIPRRTLTADIDLSNPRPIININNIGWLIQSGAVNTTYINSKTGAPQVFNTRVLDPAYQDDGTSKFYNVNRGYINVGGDLFTVTATLVGKYSAANGADYLAMQAYFIKTVMDTESQNFFIKSLTSGYEIHMKGYMPTDEYYPYYSKDAKKGIPMDIKSTYCGADGSIWGFKVPVMTRHAWEKEAFKKAYPEFKSWQDSRGKIHSDWYKHPDITKIVCPW